MSKDISNSDDIIDIRDVISRYEELESEINLDDNPDKVWEHAGITEDEFEALSDEEKAEKHTAWLEADMHEEAAEFKILEDLLSSLKGYGGDHQWKGDWYPVTLIKDDYFEDHAKELAEDIGGEAFRNASWPTNCIDWEEAAKELQTDYSSVEFDNQTYWYR